MMEMLNVFSVIRDIRYGVEEECRNHDLHSRKGGGIIKSLTVTTDNERAVD